jgi:hypothetical protein
MVLDNGSCRLELSIVRYQFPQIKEGSDSNWLIVRGLVTMDGRAWAFQDPCLMTTEAAGLVTWLEAVSQRADAKQDVFFTEPNLQFYRIDQGSIRIAFALECAPPWAKQGEDWRLHGFDVVIGAHIADAALQLREQLSHFPQRGDDD